MLGCAPHAWARFVTCSLLTQLSYSQQEAVLPLSWLGGGQKPSWTCQEGSEMAETTQRSNTTTTTIRLTSEEAETVRSAAAARRTEARRVGKECVRTCRSRGSTCH